MRKNRKIAAIAIAIVLLLGSCIPSFAFGENETRSIENFFIEAKLLKGDNGDYGFDRATTRMEGIILLIRLLGKEAEAVELQSVPCSFSDVPTWAAGYANYAYQANITKGVGTKLFGVNEPMTVQQFCTLLLRAIGYDDNAGDFKWSRSVTKANDLDILPDDLINRYFSTDKFTKKDLIETSFCFLEAPYKDGSGTILKDLIEEGVLADELVQRYGLLVDQWDSITTNFSDDDHFRFELKDDSLTVTGKSNDADKEWLLLQIKNKETGEEESSKTFKRSQDGSYEIVKSVANLPKGTYYVNVFGNDEKYNYYTSFILSSLIMKVTSKEQHFVPSPAYAQNLRVHEGNQVEREDELMNLETRLTKESIETVRALAAEITEDCITDYDKVQAVHDWVAEHIYYDKDFFTGKTKTTDVYTIPVLESRHTVCSGYANLTKDLLAASGIPCKEVMGYALGISKTDDWDNVDLVRAEPNHVWNEAYVDGRWIILDTTWDSQNTYAGGEHLKGDRISQLYFDITVPFLSSMHYTIKMEGSI